VRYYTFNVFVFIDVLMYPFRGSVALLEMHIGDAHVASVGRRGACVF
jgi:hypothetical protein